MRIGLFTDTYRPSINGIVFVVEMLKKRLEEQGHEVYIFCPGGSLRRNDELEFEDDHIVRFPSIPSGFFDDFDISLMFPPRIVRQIRDLDLDVVHVFTPSQVGLIGMQAAWKYEIPFIMQHSTDLYEFAEHYPSVLPGVLALVGIFMPMTVRLKGQDVREIIKLYRPRRHVTKWNRDIIERAITILYSKADAVIALSRKSADQLCSWQHHENYRYNVTMMPNGVDGIPAPQANAVRAFRRRFGIKEGDEVYGFVGRLAAEKNLDLLIKAAELIVKTRPQAKLIFVGDFDYRETLEDHAAQSKAAGNIIFTGAMPREELGIVYAAFDVFVFPSLKDTQGWVLHEAAHAGLPIVLIDKGVSEVAIDGVNAIYAKNNASSLAKSVIELLADEGKRKAYGAESQIIARKYSERRQIKALIKLYKAVIRDHTPHHETHKRLLRRVHDDL